MPTTAHAPGKPEGLKLCHRPLSAATVTNSAWGAFCLIISRGKKPPTSREDLVRLMRESFRQSYFCRTHRYEPPAGQGRKPEMTDVYLDPNLGVKFLVLQDPITIVTVTQVKAKRPQRKVRTEPIGPKSRQLTDISVWDLQPQAGIQPFHDPGSFSGPPAACHKPQGQ